MTIKRNDMVLEIMGLYDKIDELKLQLKEKTYETYPTATLEVTAINDPDNALKAYAIEKGKQEILSDVLYSWEKVNIERRGAVNIATPFDEWVKKKVQRNSIPPWVSTDSFMSFFDSDLHAIYEKEKLSAIQALEKSELKEAAEK